MAEKVTKRQNFEVIKDLLENLNNPDGFVAPENIPDLVAFIDHEIELLARKSSKSATLTPEQKDKIAVGEIVKDVLAECSDVNGMTVGAILADKRIASYVRHKEQKVNSQLITRILTDFGEPTDAYPNRTNEVKRTVVKKVAYYSLNYGIKEEGEGV